MKLLIRRPGDEASASPFEAGLRAVASAGSLDLAAPYLSVSLLREVTKAAGTFRLVTDAEEWLRAFARPARQDILAFIAEHPTAVRHYRDLHAKVALSPALAMFGSANFTQRGLFERQEVGALVDDPVHVATLRDWYSALWSLAFSIELRRLREFEDSLPPQADSDTLPTRRTLPAPSPDGDAFEARAIVGVNEDDIDWDEDTEDRLVAYLKYAPSRRWTEEYFEAIATLIEALGVENGDKRFVLSIRMGAFTIPVTINSRWVLRPYAAADPTAGLAGAKILIRAGSPAAVLESPSRLDDDSAFRAQPGESDEPPVSVAFRDFAFLSDRRFLDEWLIACQVEFLRKSGSQNQRHHSRTLFRAATDRAYRQRLFARVDWASA